MCFRSLRSLLRRGLAVGLFLFPLAALSAAELPPREIASTDQAEFRRFVLENGLRVILVSDPKFNKSASSIAVGVGQIDDPFEHPGLAHFLEHMISRGSEKYPDAAEFQNYISANGGYSNAYTASDHTNYLFEVRHDALEGALDRTAQSFISPIFPADLTEREVNAVHNEAMRHVQSDFRRMINVRREIYAPESGESIFSTGNKTTLAHADEVVVRRFFEENYSPERMALSIASSLPLDELEKYARTYFSAIPARDLPEIPREPIFLPRQEALRLATIEPVKEIREIYLEFPIPALRPDFASKPGELVVSLLNYAGEGGLIEALKAADLATGVGAFRWERTTGYGSLFIAADLTPHGAENVPQFMEMAFAYLEHLRAAPFPAAFFADQARIAALKETYEDRGEGTDLAVELANAALFYPLELAERAEKVWGAPDEAAYRDLLSVLTPDNMLATFAAKGVPTDRTEEIYGTAYAYTEDTGERYARLWSPPAVEGFALPAPNPFLPGETRVLAERPLPLIDEPGLKLFYAQDVEFERPRSTLRFRFVPVRAVATPRMDLLLRFYQTCLSDALEAAAGDAAIAGVSYEAAVDLESLELTVTGFADSPVRFAEYVAGQLLQLEIAPARFASLKEYVIRSLSSYEQTEAYQLARDHSTALMREFFYPTDHSLAAAGDVTWEQVQAALREYLAAGKIEAIAHGHLTPETAVAAARSVAASIGAEPVGEDALLRRRHLVLAPGETVVETAVIKGVNSSYRANYLLPDETPALRATATLIGNFMNTPYFDELRTKQQLGYIVGSAAGASLRQWLFLYVIQSSEFDVDVQRARSEAFLATLPELLAGLPPEEWATLVEGARAQLEEKPKSIAEKAARMFRYGYDFDGEWERRAEALEALEGVTQADAVALLREALDPAQARAIVILLASEAHAPSAAAGSFSDWESWKDGRRYE